MANIIVGVIVFGLLGFIIYKSFLSKHTSGSSCHTGCKTCPYACDKRD